MRVLTFAAILRDGSLELEPGFVTEGEPSRERGELKVEVLGRGRRPLATTTLRLQTPCAPPGGETAPAAVGLVPYPEGATGVRVSLGRDLLLERNASPDDLEVDVEWPASLAGAATVGWQASADTCFASLGYSNDRGRTWTPVSLPGPGNSIEVDSRTLPGGPECFLELIVTDGFHTKTIRSDAYAVEPKGWALWILSPTAGAKLSAGQPVLLAAQGYNLEERIAGFDDITWVSSAGGHLGRGARLLAVLEPGAHTIRAIMHDVTTEVAVVVA
jgi:hypothetical protein